MIQDINGRKELENSIERTILSHKPKYGEGNVLVEVERKMFRYLALRCDTFDEKSLKNLLERSIKYTDDLASHNQLTITFSESKNELEMILKDCLSYAITRLSSITRYNTRPFIKQQNVMQHQGDVTLIAMVFSDYFNEIGISNDTEKVLRMAITHDVGEILSGDIPHVAKYSNDKDSAIKNNFKEIVDKMELISFKDTFDKIGNEKFTSKYVRLLEEEKERETVEALIVKLADFADVIIYGNIELSLGNNTIINEIENSTRNFNKCAERLINKRKLNIDEYHFIRQN